MPLLERPRRENRASPVLFSTARDPFSFVFASLSITWKALNKSEVLNLEMAILTSEPARFLGPQKVPLMGWFSA
jgi:hypothetical protein